MSDDQCSICDSIIELIPKAGSGTVTHWVCKTCVEIRGIDVELEYLENITNFGHWHRPLLKEKWERI